MFKKCLLKKRKIPSVQEILCCIFMLSVLVLQDNFSYDLPCDGHLVQGQMMHLECLWCILGDEEQSNSKPNTQPEFTECLASSQRKMKEMQTDTKHCTNKKKGLNENTRVLKGAVFRQTCCEDLAKAQKFRLQKYLRAAESQVRRVRNAEGTIQ